MNLRDSIFWRLDEMALNGNRDERRQIADVIKTLINNWIDQTAGVVTPSLWDTNLSSHE